jgi:anti-sigma factor RsiW
MNNPEVGLRRRREQTHSLRVLGAGGGDVVNRIAMNTCDDLTLFCDRELEPERADAFRAHLRRCEACQAGLVEAMQLRARLRSMAPRSRPAASAPTLQEPLADADPDTLDDRQQRRAAAKQRFRRARALRDAAIASCPLFGQLARLYGDLRSVWTRSFT